MKVEQHCQNYNERIYKEWTPCLSLSKPIVQRMLVPCKRESRHSRGTVEVTYCFESHQIRSRQRNLFRDNQRRRWRCGDTDWFFLQSFLVRNDENKIMSKRQIQEKKILEKNVHEELLNLDMCESWQLHRGQYVRLERVKISFCVYLERDDMSVVLSSCAMPLISISKGIFFYDIQWSNDTTILEYVRYRKVTN